MRSTLFAAVCVMTVAVVALSAERAFAQSFRVAGTEFNAVRQVNVPAKEAYTVVVVEFLHQGEIRADGRNVVVAARNKDLVPFRILQLGPGDFCRVAFQTLKGHAEYEIYYGGETPNDKPPPWTCRDGLLMETRQLQPCNFGNRDSVRKAFDAATPIGADYVAGVFHGENPFSLKREPFLSRYTGWIDLPKAGLYGFITSSQDCSFLSVDDKPVASAPGYHGPMWHARPGSRHDVRLAAGLHKFQYDHAAAGSNAIMDAVWEIDPANQKPGRPTVIPREIFHCQSVGHLAAESPALRTARYAPDFAFKIIGDVPLPDNDVPLVGVLFRDTSPKSLTMQGRPQWDFGDGQTSDVPNPDHVYLRPGLYAVKLSMRRGGKTLDVTNRIYVDRRLPPYSDKLHTLDQYLRIVETYDPKTLDAVSLRQLVLTLEAKALALANRAEDAAQKTAAAEKLSAESDHYLAEAVETGKVAFTGDSAAKGDADLLKLAQLVGRMARFRLGDARSAGQIWRGAAERIAAVESKAECEIAAADIALNDLTKPAAAKSLLDAATKHLAARSGPMAGELHRVWGDYCAATGDGKSARKHYLDAQQAGGSSMNWIERTAWLGAHARSTEEFLKAKKHVRAIEELRVWEREFPAEKVDGYWTLLFARYWAGRGKYAQAIAQAEQLQAVNPDSPYIDQLLYLAADSEMRLGRKDRALATLHSLVKDYPGSPLAPKVKMQIETLEGGK